MVFLFMRIHSKRQKALMKMKLNLFLEQTTLVEKKKNKKRNVGVSLSKMFLIKNSKHDRNKLVAKWFCEYSK